MQSFNKKFYELGIGEIFTLPIFKKKFCNGCIFVKFNHLVKANSFGHDCSEQLFNFVVTLCVCVWERELSIMNLFIYEQKEEKDEDKETKVSDVTPSQSKPAEVDDEVYLMVTQMHWEDDIIWDGEEAKQRVLQSHKSRAEFAGWVPSTNSRTAAQFLHQCE